MKNKLSKGIILGVTFLSFSSAAFAQESGPLDWLANLFGFEGTMEEFVVKILNWLIGFAALICVVMLVFAGYMYMTAGGDESKVSKARKSLTNALIGLVICFVAVMLVNFVLKNFLGQ